MGEKVNGKDICRLVNTPSLQLWFMVKVEKEIIKHL